MLPSPAAANTCGAFHGSGPSNFNGEAAHISWTHPLLWSEEEDGGDGSKRGWSHTQGEASDGL